MTVEDHQEESIVRFLSLFGCGDRRDVLIRDPEATVERLVLAAVEFNHRVVNDFGGRESATRGLALVRQGIGAAFQSFDGKDLYSGIFDKAAALFRGIVAGHPFGDGNKRTGFLLAAYFLQQTGYPVPPELPTEEIEQLCLRVSAGEIREIPVISKTLRRLWGRGNG